MKKYFLLLFCFLFIGCDSKEIRDLSITSTMGIDFIDGKYRVSVIVISKEEGESRLYTGEGNSFFKAIQSVNNKLTETLYLGHIQNVIVSEKISKHGLRDILSYFLKEDIIQNNFYFFLVKKTEAVKILDYLMENGGYTLSNIFKENNMFDLKKNDNSINAFINDMKDEHKDAVMHSLSLLEDSLLLHSLALFHKDKLVGFSDIIGYYLLKGNVNQVYLSYSCENAETTFSVNHMKFHTSIYNNEVIHNIDGDLSIKENGCRLPTKTKQDILKIERYVKKVMKNKMNIFLSDQKKWNVQSLDYKDFIQNKKYDKVVNHIHLNTDDLEKKGDLHE